MLVIAETDAVGYPIFGRDRSTLAECGKYGIGLCLSLICIINQCAQCAIHQPCCQTILTYFE
jgi:hypothetical protein